ncbi:MAG: ribosome biogenesis GTPase Der, partial [Deltaproteobacteria bacterium]|nr:ribosome biogenesis GTPase Der [Deltaproteobacteria bacterium]
PGVTRDRRYGMVDWPGWRFRIVDTGGLDPSAHGILGAMRTQTLRAVEEADVLVLVVDAAEGLTGVDRDVVALLRRSGKPVVLAVNKVDSAQRESALAEVFALGFEDVFAVSAGHGRGMGELLDRVVELLGPTARATSDADADADSVDADSEQADPTGEKSEVVSSGAAADANEDPVTDLALDGEAGDDDDAADADDHADGDDADNDNGHVAGNATDVDTAAAEAAEIKRFRRPEGPIRIAFVGKPNVGKSSLVNRLLGEDRVLVHDMPGTTRDPIDTPFSVGGKDFVLVDTAGLRRRRSVDTLTEAVAGKMARDQLARCDVAVLVIDAAGGATVEDAKIAGMIEESGRGAILILNKKDKVPKSQINSKIDETKEVLSFLSWAPILLTSAVTGAGVAELPIAAARVFEQASRRISTGEVNRFLEGILADKPPPAGPNGRHVRLYFATQAQICPPTFVFSANHPTAVPVSYRRFLSNQIRQAYGFQGTPIRIVLREHRKKRKSAPPERN